MKVDQKFAKKPYDPESAKKGNKKRGHRVNRTDKRG